MNSNPVSYVSVMNLAAYGGPIDIFFNGTQVSPSGGIGADRFSTQYGQFKPGSYVVDFKTTGVDSPLYELPAATYDTLKFYTLMYYNTTAGSTAVSAIRIQDDFSQITGGNAYYRFFNMSPDASSVNLLINGTNVQTNRTPADIVVNQPDQQFQPISQGSYTFQVQNNVNDSTLATLNSYPFAAGSVYTVLFFGTSKSFAVTVLPVAF